jgi:hypothetical protein
LRAQAQREVVQSSPTRRWSIGRLTGLTLGFAASLALWAALAPPAQGARSTGPSQNPEIKVYLPAAIKKASFPRVHANPTATATRPGGPRPTDGPTPSRTPVASSTPVPSATPAGGYVAYPNGADDVVMQLGITETDQPSGVWEEMHGTPWFTLYGDGTVIASTVLPDPAQTLYVGHVDDDQIQVWLRELVYGSLVYSMPNDGQELVHPGSLGKPVLGIYVNTTGGREKLVEIPGFMHWERRPPTDHPYLAAVVRMVGFMRHLEEWGGANLTELYEPEEYTLIVQHQNPNLLPDAPPWPSIALRALAAAAPTAASNYVDHVPAHKFVGATFGRELRAIVLPEAETTWGIYNRAAEFDEGGRHYAVGIRQEIPGNSMFLSSVKRTNWYRRDGDDLRAAGAALEMALLGLVDRKGPRYPPIAEPMRLGLDLGVAVRPPLLTDAHNLSRTGSIP